ncbi:MAG: hypothetical protein JST89_01560 [Cyanobacteria bacterium SZAS-4]|nr:hypothetical protein [Cyanobacteria bacterium SZAS-4]
MNIEIQQVMGDLKVAPKYDTPEAQAAAKTGTTEAGVKYLEQQGRTSQDIQAYIRDLHENNPKAYRETIDSIYRQVRSDASDPAKATLNGLLPKIDLTDNSVDPQGALNDRANFSGDSTVSGVQTDASGHAINYGGTAADGRSGMFMNDKGQTTAFSVGDQGGVQVTSTGQDGAVTTFNHTDVDPKSVKLDPNTGELTMNRTGLGDGQTGTVTVHPGGAETTAITNKDQTVTTIDRTQAGGDITGFHSNAPGQKNIHFENGKWSGLPGVADGTQPANVRVEANGKVAYDLPNENSMAVSPEGAITTTYKGGKVSIEQGPDGHLQSMTVNGNKLDIQATDGKVDMKDGYIAIKDSEGHEQRYINPTTGQMLELHPDGGWYTHNSAGQFEQVGDDLEGVDVTTDQLKQFIGTV